MNQVGSADRVRVLVADDAEEVRTLVRLVLEDSGLEVVAEATNGAEAVALAEAHRPQVLLLDVAMPVMDGLEALDALRRRCPDVPVVMHSGFAAADLADRCLRSGAVAYVQKGGDPAPLAAALRAAALGGLPAVPAPRSAPYAPTVPRGAAHDRARRRPGALLLARLRRRRCEALAAVLHALVLGLQTALGPGDPAATLSLLHVVPVTLLARRSGLRGGALGAAVGTALLALHLQLRAAPPPGWTATVPVVLALLVAAVGVGASADRLQLLLSDEQRSSEAVVAANQQLAKALAESRRTVGALEAANGDLTQFGYVVSHDLADPLRTMSGFCGLLEADYADVLDDRGREYLGLVRSGAVRMRALIDDLRTYTAAGQRDLVPAPVDLALVVADVRAALAARLEERHAVVEHGPLPTVLGDRSMLAVVLQNLVANAVKFNASGAPTVRLSARPAAAGAWAVDVRDNGIGIDPGSADRVFGLFARLHAREEYPGTGLGLAVARRVVERHDGHIEVLPVPSGALLRITIPGVPAGGGACG